MLAGVGGLIKADDARRVATAALGRRPRPPAERSRRSRKSSADCYDESPKFAWISVGRPSVNCFHVVPPSVDLKMPLPEPPNSCPSMKLCCCCQSVA